MNDISRDLLKACRDKFGPAPRELNREEKASFHLGLSVLMRTLLFLTGDKLRLILRDQRILRDQGKIVWGVLVQANSALFDPANRQTLPVNLLYSPDPSCDDQIPMLQDLASAIFQLKSATPGNAQLRQFSLAVSNETLRTMRLRVPRSLWEGAEEVYFTTCFIHPPHLPSGFLAANFFPLVICPEKTEAVMVLPSQYWPRRATPVVVGIEADTLTRTRFRRGRLRLGLGWDSWGGDYYWLQSDEMVIKPRTRGTGMLSQMKLWRPA